VKISRRRRVSLALTAAAILLMGAESPSSCSKSRHQDRNPTEVNPNMTVFRVVMTAVCGKAVAPCEVTMEARNVANPKEAQIIGPIPVAGGTWTNHLEYNIGRAVQITVTLKASRTGKTSDAYVSIADGPTNGETEHLLGRTARATLTTVRG
jgi:hypothetical protein